MKMSSATAWTGSMISLLIISLTANCSRLLWQQLHRSCSRKKLDIVTISSLFVYVIEILALALFVWFVWLFLFILWYYGEYTCLKTYLWTVVIAGLCPDWQDWNPANNVDNATEAMDAAEQWLDVPQVQCFSLLLGAHVNRFMIHLFTE